MVVRALQQRRYRITTQSEPESTHIYAERNRYTRFGTFLTHGGIILAIAAAVLGNLVGFNDNGLVIPDGSVRAVGHDTGLSVLNEGFIEEDYPDGRPRDYRSDLVIYENGVEVKRQTVRVNEPVEYRGVRFHQSFFGNAAVIRVRDTDDAKVLFEDGVALAYRNRHYGEDRTVGFFTPFDGRLDIDVVGMAQDAVDDWSHALYYEQCIGELPVEADILTALLLGLLLGAKHALDADHVVAITTIVTRSRGILRSAMVGLAWGIGHNLTLFAAGLAVLVLRLSIPPALALSVEFAVGALLVVLGAPLAWRVVKGKPHVHVHQHDNKSHLHAHSHADTPGHDHAHIRKPLLVGMLQGLAGSAALTLLVLSTMPSLGRGLLFLAVFAVGITLTMVVLSGLISLPFRLTDGLSLRLNQWLQGLAGIGSIALGLSIMWQTGLAGNLFHFLSS